MTHSFPTLPPSDLLYQPFRYAMYPAQYVASLFRHDDHSRGTADDCLQHAALVRIGPVKHGMESRKQWNICAVQYLQQHLSRRTAENAIYVQIGRESWREGGCQNV